MRHNLQAATEKSKKDQKVRSLFCPETAFPAVYLRQLSRKRKQKGDHPSAVALFHGMVSMPVRRDFSHQSQTRLSSMGLI